MNVNGVAVFFEPDDQAEAVELGGIAADVARITAKHWGLTPPRRYRVYVMTSLIRFRLHSAPWPYWLILLPLLPFWYHFGMKIWPKMDGVTERWAFRPAIGVKPRRLLEALDSSVGQRFMIGVPDISVRLRLITAHELMHAFTAHLRLPMWLSEGLAMLSSECYLGTNGVKPESRELLMPEGKGKRPEPYHRITDLDAKTLAYQYLRGYWITRYLDEKHPVFLRDLLKKRRSHAYIENAVAGQLAIRRRRLWRDVDAIVAGHFVAAAS